MSTTIDLNGTWNLTWRPIGEASDVPQCSYHVYAEVPGDVHQDLVRAGLLPEPLVGVNAPKHEWVERAVFTYERELCVDSEFDRAELVFHGLDCLAEVSIDSRMVGASANAFVPHVFDVTDFVGNGRTQSLLVNVDTGVEWGRGQDRRDYRNADNPERMFLRKSQFSFKWDWAPRLVTCGIWRGAELKLYRHAALRDVMLTPKFAGSGATLEAAVEVEAFSGGEYVLKLRAGRGERVWEAERSVSLQEGRNEAVLQVDVRPVERWWPAGYGDQALYDVEVTLEKSGEEVDRYATSYGFREVIVRRDPVRDGEQCFVININGVDIFCKGANWVPADSLCARVSDEKYAALIDAAVEANFNMLRIWGGGIYENKTFYDLCDSRGILLWHDFMFACSEYPDDQEWFTANVRDEAVKAVRRLRNHPSIALWCGNNENDWIYGFNERGKGGRCVSFYGARIYHEILPEVCSALDPLRPYWPSSPFGGDDPNCEEMGDRHAWQVSILEKDLPARADIRNYAGDRGKFNSEYGVISYALPRTILQYTGDSRIDFESEAYLAHDNSFNANVTQTESLTDWYLRIGFGSIPSDPLTYIRQSLAYQAMGYREAISDFRIRKFDCAGSLFWMYSDCWGTLGWTIIDYYLRKKPSFYWVKKAYAPVAVFARVEGDTARTYVVNDTLADMPVTLSLEVADVSGEGRRVDEDLLVPANGVAVGPALPCGPGYAFAMIRQGGETISEDLILTRFPSEMEVPKVDVTAETRQVGDELELHLSSDGFGHFVYLDLPDGAEPSDNYFNMAPGRPKVVRVSDVSAGDVKVGALNLGAR